MSFLKKLFGKQPPPEESNYDYPGEYADRFDGVEPQAPQGGDSSTHEVGHWMGLYNGSTAPEGAPASGVTPEEPGEEAAAKFAISGDAEIASFSELQGITTKVDVVDYMESTDESSLDPAVGLGSFAKVGGLDVDMDGPAQGEPTASPDLTGETDPAEAPDDNSSTWMRVGQLATGGSMAPDDDPAPHELTDTERDSHVGEGGINDFVHKLPGPDPAPDDLQPPNADPAIVPLRSVAGLPVEHEVEEYENDDDEHGSTLLRLTADPDLPDPEDVREADADDEPELEDLIDLL